MQKYIDLFKKNDKKIIYWTAIVLAVFFVFRILRGGWIVLLIIIMWCGVIYILRQFAFNGKYVWWMIIIVFASAIVFSLRAIPSDNNAHVKDVKISNSVLPYDGKVYKITSINGNIEGTAAVHAKEGGTMPISVQYNIHVNDIFPVNKKCFEGPYKTDDGCRWIDFYNYAGGLFDENGSVAQAQLYPIFCDTAASITDPTQSLMKKYIECWYGKGNKQKDTEMYYWSSVRSFKNIEDFLAANILQIYDAAPYTARIFDGGTSTEKIDTQKAVMDGQAIKIYNLTLTE